MVNVVGSTPISFTGTDGFQKSVPLSALQFNGSTIEFASTDWTGKFDAAEALTLTTLAQQLATAGVLVPQPVPPAFPALVFTATRNSQETNGIVVTATPPGGPPLASAPFGIRAVETDTWSGLTSAADAAMQIGTDTPPANQADPPEGTGIVVVKAAGVATGAAIPVGVSGTLDQTSNKTLQVKDASSNVLFTIAPCAGYTGTAMTVTVTADTTSFTVEAVYDSRAEAGGNDPTMTVLTLNALPAEVAFLVTAAAPSSGPAAPTSESTVQLSGGGPNAVASGVLYTSS